MLLNKLKAEGEEFVVNFSMECIEEQKEQVMDLEIKDVLKHFGEIFQAPQELLANRTEDHTIFLKEGATVTKLSPYRYPYYQKMEIEKLTKEMLQARLIRLSVSPYSSPVILVKKEMEDDTFCIDYKALNKLTVPNKFFIPVIEELLDELSGATIFA